MGLGVLRLPCGTHLLFMFVAATARMSVPCISTWLISSLLLTWRSQAPAKLTPVGSSRMVTTGLGAEELAHNRSRTSSCMLGASRERQGSFMCCRVEHGVGVQCRGLQHVLRQLLATVSGMCWRPSTGMQGLPCCRRTL